jgi:membrane-associated phospholipid phosphatase
MELTKMRDNIGVLAPIFLLVLSIFFLRHQQFYLYFFLGGYVLNNILNYLLKMIIKEPRPLHDRKSLEIGIKNGVRIGPDKFGMPSGHAQTCGFALSYITATVQNPIVTGFYLVISGISLFQRYLYNNHSILQLGVGFVIGIGFGYAIYLTAHNYITGNMETKRDDEFMD